ncbi:signal peptidase I [Clostridium brassicae]|uniref:Signal peptidase I n=1 Tax=Clostridium brassicae TaxID=2999072 RepID=A0ABT4DCH5_9CLOT|nr:signal peptidase I [Clostridium brassicae]MCY6960014.1 signal peptidase I [Clostridium brassicae]
MKNLKESLLKEWGKFIVYIIMVFSIGILLNSEVYAISIVDGPSMENTLINGEKLYVDKVTYHFTQPKKGDIIIFLQNETNLNCVDKIESVIKDIAMNITGKTRMNRLVKRVIGVPGDKIDIKNGEVYVNNKIIEESYIKNKTFKGLTLIDYPIVVPEGKLFVMGDNREESRDSRSFGLVDIKSVEGKAVFRIWPLNKIGTLN